MEEQTVTDLNNRSRAATTWAYILSRSVHFFKNGQALYWCSFFILILIEFLLGGQLSRMLTRNNYSLYVNALNTLPFYNVVVNLGLSYGIVYIISYNPDIKFRVFRQTLRLQTVWYLILVAIHLTAYFIFNNSIVAALLITAIISFTYSYRLNINSLFLATRSYKKAALANVLQKVALIIIFLVIFYSDQLRQLLNGRFMLLYPGIELGVVLLYFIVFRHTNSSAIRAPKTNYRRRLIKFGKYATFNNGLNLLNYTIIALIIKSSHTDINIQIIFLLCVVFFRYTGVAIAPVLPIMNPLFTAVKNDPGSIKKMYRKYYAVIFSISLLALLGCRFFFGFIINNFYAEAYHNLPGYFNFFAYLIPLSFINSLNASVMAALGKIKYTFRVEILCTVILCLFFTYGLLSPIADYHVFYYFILIHLTVKFLLQTYGAYRLVYK